MLQIIAAVAEAVFWTALLLCLYAYGGFPLGLGVLARLLGKEHRRDGVERRISVLVAAYNEAQVIEARIANCLRLDYPADKLETIVVSDGSDDGTDDIIRRYVTKGVVYCRLEPRAGKPTAMNRAAALATGEILVLCDANTMFARDALRKISRHFADPAVGGVTTDVRLRSEHTTCGEGEGLFYRLERFCQRCESRLWTTIGVDGGMYAVPSELYVPNRPDTLIDDFVIAMHVACAGRRIVYDPEATAEEDAVLDPRQEFRRRIRTTAGGFQSLLSGRGRPRWNQPGLWVGYLSHKGLRWLGPFLLIFLLLGCATVVAVGDRANWAWRAYLALAALQAAFYLLAGFGALLHGRRLPRLISVPYYFCLGNAAALMGFLRWLSGIRAGTWEHADRSAPLDSG